MNTIPKHRESPAVQKSLSEPRMPGAPALAARTRAALTGILLGVALLSSCSSLHNLRIAQEVDNASKAELLVAKGRDSYDRILERDEELERIDEVRGWFESALYFDPVNPAARRYISILDVYVEQYAAAQRAEAQGLLSKKALNRNDEEALLIAVAKARKASPDNEEGKALLEKTQELRDRTLKALVDTAKEKRKEASEAADDASREIALAAALLAAEKARLIGGAAPFVAIEYRLTRARAGTLVSDWKTTIRKEVAEKRYQQALSIVDTMSRFNARTLASFAREEEYLRRGIYLDWAKQLNEEGQLSQALEKAIQARDVAPDRGSEETVRRMAQAAAQENAGAAADKTVKGTATDKPGAKTGKAAIASTALDDSEAELERVETALASRKLSLALRTTAALKERPLKSNHKTRLAGLEKRIASLARELYDEGLAAYRNEDFKGAISALSQVSEWNPRYEQVADYLERAREKQKLIDRYSN